MNIKALAAAGVLAFASTGLAAEQPQPTLKTQNDKASYGIGRNVGTRFKHDSIDLNIEAFVQGFKDVLAGKPSAVSDEEIKEALQNLGNDVKAKAAAAGEKNKKDGDEFLAQNKTKEGVKATPSGLQYKVVKEGTGASPKATDTVTVHYKGTLLNGEEFDSSYSRNEPISFPLNGVIPGWTEGLQLMKPGAKYQFFIPPQLAYGEQGDGPIPPNSLLVFEVELIKIGEAAPAK